MSGYCARCAMGARPDEWCDGCPNRPRPVGKTWMEDAIERWIEMEPSDEATRLLQEILHEQRKSFLRREPRRLFKGTVLLRRLERNEARRSRMRRTEISRCYQDAKSGTAVPWPFAPAGAARDEEAQPYTFDCPALESGPCDCDAGVRVGEGETFSRETPTPESKPE